MSVATKNPFAILDEDNSRPSSPVPAPKKESAPPAPPAPARTQQKTRGGPAARGGKYYARGGKPPSKDSLNPDEPAAAAVEGERKLDSRGRGRGGRGGNAGGQRGGRRPFDRHSQTGKIDSDKKIHQSWGGDDPNQELKAEQAASTDAAAEATTADAAAGGEWGLAPTSTDVDAWAAPATDAAAPAEGEKADRDAARPPRREREPEEEDNTLTLDQYLAQQKDKDAVIPKLENTRKANEGADANIWKDVVPLAKEEEDAYFVGKTKSAPKAKAKKEEKVFLEIDARFERPDRGGRGRGGRGGDRGGERRGAPRGSGRGARGGRQNGPAAPAVNVDDQAAFPSLS